MAADRVGVTAFRERFTTCASCRAAAVVMVLVDGRRFSTACRRHVSTWERRAAERLKAEADA